MADRFYGLDRGDVKNDISEDSSSPTKDVEVAVDLAIGMDKSEVLILLDEIKAYILENQWPPA